MMMYRQGDVLIVSNPSAELDGPPVEREGGRLILAHGEATGHAHAIAAAGARMWTRSAGEFSLELDAPASLEHEEHDRIDLPAGKYTVIRQKEYTPEADLWVAD